MAAESIDDFITRMEVKYEVAPEFHKHISDSVRRFCTGRSSEEVTYFLCEIEGAYVCRSQMEVCVKNLKSFLEVIASDKDNQTKSLAIDSYKKEFEKFNELQRYVKSKVDEHIGKL